MMRSSFFVFFSLLVVACGSASDPSTKGPNASSEPSGSGTGTGTGTDTGTKVQDSSPIATVSPFTCTGTSTVPNHPTYTYHFTYDGSTSGALDESNAKGTTSLAPALHCTIRMSQPPPGPGGGGNFVSTVAGLECNSWSDGPSSGYQVSIAIDPSSTHATGTLRLCIDDNCPTLADLISNDTITNFSCDGVSVKP